MTVAEDMRVNLENNKSISFLRSLTLFSTFSEQELLPFINAAQTRNYPKGTMLYLESERATAFYIICSGWIKLSRMTEDGEEVVLTVHTRGSITGESALFENGRYASSAQVVEAAQVMSIPIKLLKEGLKTNNKLALNMLASMVQYQREHELHLEQYLLYSAPQRIGCFLLGLCPVLDQKDGLVLSLPYDKSLIASTLGMKAATFSRALNILRQETGIQIKGTQVKIASMKRLLKFVNGCYSYPNQHKH